MTDVEIARIAFDALLGLVNLGIVYVLTSMRAALSELRETDRRMSEKINAIDVMVASSYLKRDEFRASMKDQTDTILRALDQQQTQIDGKQDRAR